MYFQDDFVNKTIKTELADNNVNKDTKPSNNPAEIKIVDLEAEQSSVNIFYKVNFLYRINNFNHLIFFRSILKNL